MDIPDFIPSKYKFVTLVAKRVAQLQAGAKPRVPVKNQKLISIAMQEVAEGLIDEVSLEDVEPEEAVVEELESEED